MGTQKLRGKLDLLRKTSGLGVAFTREPDAGHVQEELVLPYVASRQNNTSALASALPTVGQPEERGVQGHFHDELCKELGAQILSTSQGELAVISDRFDSSHRYGCVSLEAARSFSPGILSRLYDGVENVLIEQALFFDTETTGLAGGSGSYAFLVGLGYFQDGDFITEQLLLRDFSDEAAMLERLTQLALSHTSLISFNGKCFDVPLLSTRFAMHRREDPMRSLPHFDLLHVCRRLWGQSKLRDCRLETLERYVLKEVRVGDIPGWMIPDVFFSFLRDRCVGPLKPIVDHNRRDVLAMVGLCAWLADILSQDEPGAANPGDPDLCVALARLWSELGHRDRSTALYHDVLKRDGLSYGVRFEAMYRWARDLKHQGEYDRAAKVWYHLLMMKPEQLDVRVELAKWLEHHRQDYRTALGMVEVGLRTPRLVLRKRLELEHRAQRLRMRLAKKHKDQSQTG